MFDILERDLARLGGDVAVWRVERKLKQFRPGMKMDVGGVADCDSDKVYVLINAMKKFIKCTKKYKLNLISEVNNSRGKNLDVLQVELVIDFVRKFVKSCEHNLKIWFGYIKEARAVGTSDLGLPHSMEPKTVDDIKTARLIRVTLMDRLLLVNKKEFVSFMNTQYDKVRSRKF